MGQVYRKNELKSKGPSKSDQAIYHKAEKFVKESKDFNYLSMRDRGILEYALKEKNYADLKQFTDPIIKRGERDRIRIQAENKERKMRDENRRKSLYGDKSVKQLKNERSKLKKDVDALHEKYKNTSRVTQRRVQNQTKTSMKLNEISDIDQVIKEKQSSHKKTKPETKKEQKILQKQSEKNTNQKMKNLLEYKSEIKNKPLKPEVKKELSEADKKFLQQSKQRERARENGKAQMKENKELVNYYLKTQGLDKIPKNSSMNFMQIASLMRQVKEGSSDWKADSILDAIDLKMEYDENKEIVNEKYPNFKDRERSNQLAINEMEVNRKREFLEDYYLEHAEDNPMEAIRDSSKADKPIRRILPNGKIDQRWLKNPFSKSGGDYEGIDDGSNPYTEEDFMNEMELKLRALQNNPNYKPGDMMRALGEEP